ncbi:hypothetical protein [Mycolicibacterium sp. XJ1819]
MRIRTLRTLRTLIVTGAAALGLLFAPMLVATQASAQPVDQYRTAPCYPGFIPGNPYVPSCNVGPRQGKPPGGTADQTAVIACRGIPGCLSWYINGPH